MKKILMVSLVVLMAFAVAAPAFAGQPSPWTTKTTWSEKAIGKLDFGFKNLFGGWTEIFTEPKEAYDAKGNVFEGVGRGIWNFVGDTIGGALHLVTFPIVQIDIPLPEGGVSL